MDAGQGNPARLRARTSWQPNTASAPGARMTGAAHMPLTATADFAVLAALEEYGQLSQDGPVGTLYCLG